MFFFEHGTKSIPNISISKRRLLVYEFRKQGTIYKGMLFQQLPEYNWFNLAMRDIDPKSGEIEFDELTGNGDARKVFATIAEIVKRILKIILIGRSL